MSTAYLFPGQGAQYVGMGQELYASHPEVRSIFDRASAVLGYDAAQVCFEDPDDIINTTEFTQPLMLTVSVATYSAWVHATSDIQPDFLAGLSLGEYTALVAAGSISLEDAVRITRMRGRFMQEAVPKGVGTMAAIIGLDAHQVEELCETIRSDDHWVEPANYNCPGQVVVSGHTKAVRALCKAAKASGATKAVPLPVSAPFHSRLLQPAADKLVAELERVKIVDARVPVVANVSGSPVKSAAEIKRALIKQVASPVRFEQSLRYMIGQGTRVFVELGPGQALSKFVSRVDPTATACSVSDNETMQCAAESLGVSG